MIHEFEGPSRLSGAVTQVAAGVSGDRVESAWDDGTGRESSGMTSRATRVCRRRDAVPVAPPCGVDRRAERGRYRGAR